MTSSSIFNETNDSGNLPQPILRKRICIYRRRSQKYRILILIISYLGTIAFVQYQRFSQSLKESEEMITGTDINDVMELSGDHVKMKYISKGESRAKRSVVTTESSIHVNISCEHSNVNDFPANIFSDEFAKSGGWVFNLLLAIYVFGCIAQVCDDYFVPSLEHFCEDLGLSPDVAGATFMAAGSSAPELCTSVIGVFVAKSDVGTGAIVGSSIFNILIITGCIGLFSGMVMHISWYPVSRDIFFYVTSVAILVLAVSDSNVTWVESTGMLMVYLFYIIIMVFNTKIRRLISSNRVSQRLSRIDATTKRRNSNIIAANMEARLHSHIGNKGDVHGLKSVGHDLNGMADKDTKEMCIVALRRASSTNDKVIEKSQVKAPQGHKPVYKVASEDRHVVFESCTDAAPESVPPSITSEEKEMTEEELKLEEEEYVSPLTFPDDCFSRTLFIVYFPVRVLHAFTIPDSRIVGGWQAKVYAVSFMFAVAYIAAYSYFMVWMSMHAGSAMGIPDAVVGLTILAAGTSVPDLMSSVYIARDGYGDMAVSNAIGSNIFDILIGLGLPWFIDSVSEKNRANAQSNTAGVYYTSITLFVTAIFVWIYLLCNHWNLDKTMGLVLVIVYVIIITFCILVEMNVFFNFTLEC